MQVILPPDTGTVSYGTYSIVIVLKCRASFNRRARREFKLLHGSLVVAILVCLGVVRGFRAVAYARASGLQLMPSVSSTAYSIRPLRSYVSPEAEDLAIRPSPFFLLSRPLILGQPPYAGKGLPI